METEYTADIRMCYTYGKMQFLLLMDVAERRAVSLVLPEDARDSPAWQIAYMAAFTPGEISEFFRDGAEMDFQAAVAIYRHEHPKARPGSSIVYDDEADWYAAYKSYDTAGFMAGFRSLSACEEYAAANGAAYIVTYRCALDRRRWVTSVELDCRDHMDEPPREYLTPVVLADDPDGEDPDDDFDSETEDSEP